MLKHSGMVRTLDIAIICGSICYIATLTAKSDIVPTITCTEGTISFSIKKLKIRTCQLTIFIKNQIFILVKISI